MTGARSGDLKDAMVAALHGETRVVGTILLGKGQVKNLADQGRTSRTRTSIAAPRSSAASWPRRTRWRRPR